MRCISYGHHTHSPVTSTSIDTVNALLALRDITNTIQTISPTTPPKPNRTSSGRFVAGHSSPPRLKLIDRYRCVIYTQDGASCRSIANRLHYTVKRWNDAYARNESLSESVGDRGRPLAIDDALEKEIVEFVIKTPFVFFSTCGSSGFYCFNVQDINFTTLSKRLFFECFLCVFD